MLSKEECKMSELERLVSIYKVALGSVSLLLGLVGYGNDYFMLGRTKFNKLKLDCTEKQYRTLSFVCKNNVFSLKNNFVVSFCTLAGSL